MLGEEERNRVNSFDWNIQFPTIMKDGGFDAVIGNPPWGATFSKYELEYLRNLYGRVVARMVDSYIYFLYRATRLVRPANAVAFIIPSTLLNQSDARPMREVLLE